MKNNELPISFPIKVLKFKTPIEYENSINRILKLKVTLFLKILKTCYLLSNVKISEEEKEKFLNYIDKKFNEINDSKVFITGQIKSEIYIRKGYF